MPFIVKLILDTFAIYHREIFPIYFLALTIDIRVCGKFCGSSSPWILLLIALFYFQEFVVAPFVFLAFLKIFLIPINCALMEDKPFLFGTLCHCEKCRGFGLFVGTLRFWECVISFLLICFICLNEINL